MKVHHVWMGVASLPLVLGLVSCSGDDDSGDSSGAGDAPAAEAPAGDGTDPEGFCLNSADEVGAALGVEGVTAAGIANEGSGGGCTYSTPDGLPLLVLSVVTTDLAGPAFEGYKETPGTEPVSGIGDEAIYLPVAESVGIAWIEDGVLVSAALTAEVDLDEQGQRDALAELARQATD